MARKSDWGAALFSITHPNGLTDAVAVSGRDRWALEALVKSGSKGCTPIDTPGPRWSGYVHNLRKLGVPIETVTESHDGPFAGTHARYVLKATVKRLEARTA
ncbi:winged helix domain-containing protein [Thalassovita sp.]|uniref:winged helix domain-containing protein n=1 Tax=Thalassovita sp. TaxID=1979401 RepID=UPI002B27AECC|nr:hypothetical protein [Thalassovita sp.]